MGQAITGGKNSCRPRKLKLHALPKDPPKVAAAAIPVNKHQYVRIPYEKHFFRNGMVS